MFLSAQWSSCKITSIDSQVLRRVDSLAFFNDYHCLLEATTFTLKKTFTLFPSFHLMAGVLCSIVDRWQPRIRIMQLYLYCAEVR